MTVEPQPARDGVRFVRLTGEVDVVSSRLLHDQLSGAGSLVLDLSDVTFFDSSGARLVDQLAREHAVAGSGFLVVAPVGGRARRVLELLGYAGELVADDIESALAQLHG